VKIVGDIFAKTQRTSQQSAAKDLIACLLRIVQITWSHQYLKNKLNNHSLLHRSQNEAPKN
jgi:hypothetical protein